MHTFGAKVKGKRHESRRQVRQSPSATSQDLKLAKSATIEQFPRFSRGPLTQLPRGSTMRAVALLGGVVLAVASISAGAVPPHRLKAPCRQQARRRSPKTSRRSSSTSARAATAPGEVAPMSLLSYEDVRPWAKAIKTKVVAREMPPWGADPTQTLKMRNDAA